jgi:8-amino-7-oxononanoate synthase
VLTDGVFSMDGDCAPLAELASASTEHAAHLMVDDAHGFGVLGAEGRGLVNVAGLSIEQAPIYMATLGKAAGVSGAFVAGSEALIETLIQKARTYIYTTATPPAVAAATRAALRLIQRDSWRREHLRALIMRFRHGVKQLGLQLMESSTAIQPIVLGEAAQALAASEALLQKGLLVTAIRPPTVPAGTARLRVTLSAAHSEQQVDQLLDALANISTLRVMA